MLTACQRLVPSSTAWLVPQQRARQSPAPLSRVPARARRVRCECHTAAAGEPQLRTLQQSPSSWQVPAGVLRIGPMAADDVGAAAVVLTRAFADGPEALSYSDVSKFLTSLLAVPPDKAQVIVARLSPTDAALLPAGRDTRLVGTAGISVDPAEREYFGPFQVRPPESAVYLSNMAVDARFQRQGIARLLLAACERAAAEAGHRGEVCLIVNEANAAARALYERAGYCVTQSDADRGFNLTRLLSRREPQLLMSKMLAGDGG